jgi:hypothetical protein
MTGEEEEKIAFLKYNLFYYFSTQGKSASF